MDLEETGQVKDVAHAVVSLANSNIIGSVFSDSSGRVLDANDEFLRIVGYSREDLDAGRLNWKSLTAPGWLEMSQEAVIEVQVTGKAPVFEKEYLRKDGTRVPVLIG